MANFDNAETKATSVRDANNLLAHVRGAYQSSKATQDLMARYQSGADPIFNGAVNALYSGSERAEFGAMLVLFNALVTGLETNHGSAIGIV